MSDLEKIVDPSLNDNNTTENIPEETPEIETSTTSENVEKVQDLSEMFENNASEHTDQNEEFKDDSNYFEENSTTEENFTTEENNNTEVNMNFDEINSSEENNITEETTIPEENMTSETVNSPEENNNIDLNNSETSLEETPSINENVELQEAPKESFQEEITNKEVESPTIESTAQPTLQQNNNTQEQNKQAQKEKLLELIKTHESKSQKEWFIKWIISWIIIGAILLIGVFLLAKEQIFNIFYNTNDIINNTSIEEIDNKDDDEIDTEEDEDTIDEDSNELTWDIQEVENINEEMTSEDYRNKIREFLSSWKETEEIVESLDEMLNKILEDEEHDEELVNYIQQTRLDLTINSKAKEDIEESTSENEENNETANNEEQTNEEETEDNTKNYTITHVTSEQDANRVLPSHCTDLDCYGTGKEFITCTNFRLTENLDENAHRIWSNWTCRYKDVSELVYVEFK